jgi:gliding motility-associated lipoprotein GldH
MALLSIAGCGPGDFYAGSQSVPGGLWPSDRFYRFEVRVGDTVNPFNIHLHVRNDGRYEYSNLWLFIRTNSPTGAVLKDTVECLLSNDEGKWLGRGSGGRFTIEIPYRYMVRFPNSGTYTFEIQQGMRARELKYITDIGLRIRKAV